MSARRPAIPESESAWIGAVLCVTCAAHAQTGWLQAKILPATDSGAMAYDAARGRVVQFGGSAPNGGPYLDETWEWDGSAWNLRRPLSSPSARVLHAMAYHAATARVVMFGGRYLADTWEYDGVSWIQRSPAASPSSRAGMALVEDPARGRLVLFGGNDGLGTWFSDTWEWDGATWIARSPALSPPARAFAGMAYDAARGRTVLFGGLGKSAVLADTWEWDGNAWTQSASATSPTPRFACAMAFDPVRARIVAFGGQPNSGGTSDETWEWDGNAWMQRVVTPRPGARVSHSLVWDSARRRAVLYGGIRIGISKGFTDTWEWDGNAWLLRDPEQRPYARQHHAMAYDRARDRIVLAGASPEYTSFDTWELTGNHWTAKSPSSSPPARQQLALAYDLLAGRTVLFGGYSIAGNNELGDTWTWDGTSWTNVTPVGSPPARYEHALAHDLAHGRVVLFGGHLRTGVSADTWLWDGATWTQVFPAQSPPARSGHALAYDLGRGRVVLFGGTSASSAMLSDTWEWDGSTWLTLSPGSRPPARTGHALAYDAARGRTVLFGGATSATSTASVLSDTWEWNGTAWTARAVAGPAARTAHAMAYDDARRQAVLFGGLVPPVVTLGDTWLLGASAPAATMPFGAACSGSKGPPALTSSVPFLGSTGFALELVGALPSSACAFGLAAGTQSLAIGSCSLYLANPLPLLVTTTNASGFSGLGIPIPVDPALAAAVVYAQGFVLDPGAGAGGLVFSDARRLTLGN